MRKEREPICCVTRIGWWAAREGDTEVQAEIDRANLWCNEKCEEWYGENRRRDEHFGIAIAAAQNNAPDAKEKLLALLGRRGYEAPVIARATALYYLLQIDPTSAAYEAATAIKDSHPLMRSTAMAALRGGSNPARSVSLIEQGLKDPIRSVRTEAARNLLDYPESLRDSTANADFRKALQELNDGMKFNNDRAGAHLAMGIFAQQQGRSQKAMEHYQNAIAVEPGVTGARSNLASLLEEVGAASMRDRVDALRKQELPLLQRDVKLLPEGAGLHNRLGFALYLDGQKELAAVHLEKAAELEPENAAFALAAAMIFEDQAEWDKAIRYGKAAVRLSDEAPANVQLLQRILSRSQQASGSQN